MGLNKIETMLNEYKNSFKSTTGKAVKLRKVGSCYEAVSHSKVKGGYPAIMCSSKTLMLHRLSYSLYYGKKLNPSIHIRHTCDNPACCNPKHLIEGSNFDNVQDRVRRKRSCAGNHVHTSRLTEKEVKDIFLNSSLSNKDLAQKYGVYPSNISRIKSGKQWRHFTEKLENKLCR